MKRDFDAPLVNLAGEPFLADDRKTPLTLATACVTAIGATMEGDDRLDGAKKMELFLLASRVHKGGVQEVTAEEVSVLKARIARAFNIMGVGAAFALLEADAA